MLSHMSMHEYLLPGNTRDHNNFVIVTGISGSGKDYLLGKAQEEGAVPKEVPVIPYGQEIFNRLKDLYPYDVLTRDDLKKLSHAQQSPTINQVANEIIARQPAVVNTHVVVQQEVGLSIYPTVDQKLNSKHYVFVNTDPGLIKEWRAQDTSRKRIQADTDELSLIQEISMGFTEVIANFIGARFTVLKNKTDNLSDNLEKLGEIIKTILS
jgi:adenylate kinase